MASGGGPGAAAAAATSGAAAAAGTNNDELNFAALGGADVGGQQYVVTQEVLKLKSMFFINL